MGCELHIMPNKLTDPDGKEHEVRFLYNPETEGFVSLRGLDNDDILPPSEVENWERRLEMEIPKPSNSH